MLTGRRKYSRHVYYPAGIISLVLLPVLCICHLNSNRAFEKYGAIEVSWWNPRSAAYFPDVFSKENHPGRRYSDFYLTGNEKDDEIKLNYAQLEIRDLVKSSDTSVCVHLHFGAKSRYWALVKALDICNIEKATYVPYENDIWVLNPRPRKPAEEKRPFFICGTHDMLIQARKQVADNRIGEIKFITDTAKTYVIPGLLFMLMAILKIRAIYGY